MDGFNPVIAVVFILLIGGVAGLRIWWQRATRQQRAPPAGPAASAPAQSAAPMLDRAALLARLQDRTLTPDERRQVRATLLRESQPRAAVTTAVADKEAEADTLPKAPPVPPGGIPVNGSTGKYRAMLFQEVTKEGEYNIEFPRISAPCGHPIELDQSMPEHGTAYMVVSRDGYYLPYDPRLDRIDSKMTPQRAYWAISVYQLVADVWANKYGLLEKLNAVLCALFGAGLLLVAIVAINKMAGGS